jgi:DNA polymerase elongation subunit (family B)
MIRDVLIYDLETDSLDTEIAKVKFFGAYSYIDNEYYLLQGSEKKEIAELLERHRVLVSFNGKAFDNPILINNGYEIENKYKIFIDLYEISAQKGNGGKGKYNKNKLIQMGIDIKKFTLKNIINVLKLDEDSKGDIDYKIFQKDEWTQEELKEINKYLKQDILLTKKLFEWYEEQFKPLKSMLSIKSQRNYKHLVSSLSSLAYEIICNKAGLTVEYGERPEGVRQSIEGGHHINPRKEKVKGNIVNIDFTSAYPHALMMGNLYSPKEEGWNGNGYFTTNNGKNPLKGTYDIEKQGKIESALKEILLERLKAKKEKDKVKSQGYKIVINSLYGLTGNPVFKSLYNPITASDCTSMIRTCIKKLAKLLEENDFEVLYGFTDNVIILINDRETEEELLYLIDIFINEVKSNVPFPMDTFNLELETRMKFIWFVAKNCYLYVTDKDEVKYKSTLLNTNTPKIIMQVFDGYMKPKIVRGLDICFTEDEIKEQINLLLKDNLKLACEEHKVMDIEDYKSKTSIQYQVSERYGEGTHLLIPNTKKIGVGKQKGTKKVKPVRYCTMEEFIENKLTIEDISLKKLLDHLKPFFKYKPKEDIQATL